MGSLIHIGAFKGTQFLARLPIDPTLVFLLLTLIVGIACYCRGTMIRIGDLWPLLGLWMTFILGVPFMGANTYSLNKVLLLFSVCVVVAFVSASASPSPHFVRGFLAAQVAAGVVMCGLLRLLGGTSSTGQRLLLEGGNSIGAARVVGAAAVVLIPLAFSSKVRLVPLAVVSALLLMTLIGVGSRGPAVFVIVALAFAAAFTGKDLTRRILKILGVAVLGVGLSATILWLAPTRVGAGRLLLPFTEGAQADQSVATRLSLLRTSLSLILRSPLGVGWGKFKMAARAEGLPIALAHQYPHNVFLEVGVEAGWIPLLALLSVVCLALAGLRRQSLTTGSTLFALGIYFIGNALVSGDITGNRAMWALVGFGVGCWMQSRSRSAGNYSDQTPTPVTLSTSGRSHASEGRL